MDSEILLESGTNELEILEFKVGNNHYGINVAKVQEILSYEAPTPVPNSHASIEGIFMPRDSIITVINLPVTLNLPLLDEEKQMLIITNFNQLQTAFHVQSIVGIHRVSWTDITKPDSTISSSANGIATGIIRLNNELIIILDFEKILSDISPETGIKISDIDKLGERERNSSPILIAEDSPLLAKMIHDSLYKAGYVNLTMTSNGLEAWNLLQDMGNSGDLLEKVKCVITDIEMPQMDGHRLTKLIKSDWKLSQLPVIIFSSIINEDMRKKGETLGADAQLSKPEIGQLVATIDELLQNQR